MSSTTLDPRTTNFHPENTASSHDVLPPKTAPATPTGRGVQAFEAHTRKHRTASRLPSHCDFPERDSKGINNAKGRNDNKNGLASPSITPPSAYNKHSQTRHHPSSPSLYGHYQREAHTAPDSWGVPPISPCASITHPSTTSAAEYLLQSAASPSRRHSASSSSSSSSPDPSPSPPSRLRFPTSSQPSTSAYALSTAEQNALTSLSRLHTHTPTPTHATNRPRPHPLFSSPTNALSALPPSHAHKLACALSLLALRAHCLREEEVFYRRLLVARNLSGDEDLYSDADTVEDEEDRRVNVEVPKSERVADSDGAPTPSPTRTGTPRERAVGRGNAVFERRRMVAGKAKGEGKGEGDAQRDLDDARKKVNARGRKAVRAPRTGTGKRGGVVGAALEVERERRRWTVQALGYRRERGRKRAGTAGRV